MGADGQRQADQDAICEARASACVSMYSRMLASLPSRTVMAKIQLSSNDLPVALILPLAKPTTRSEEHTSELQSLMRISYAVFCLKTKKQKTNTTYQSSKHKTSNITK